LKNRNGEWLHMEDCTYCQLRKIWKKAIDKKWEMETCTVTDNTIPAPRKGVRSCEHFKQTGCGCPKCVIVVHQSEYTIDKEEVLC
jgi:hypothetical protein